MNKKITTFFAAMLAMFTMVFAGCSASISTNTSTSNAKPANAAPANANTASNSAAAAPKKEGEKPAGPKLADEKKPEGKAKTVKTVTVPEDWVYVYNEQRGYGFEVPADSTGESNTVDGVDVFAAMTPSEIGVMVLAFKDASLSKEDLLDAAEKVLSEMGQTVQAGKLTGESEDYSVAEATMTGKDGKKSKVKVLVGTDVTDNYVMIVGTEEAKFAANEKIIDMIWGSFEMWSGGASGGK